MIGENAATIAAAKAEDLTAERLREVLLYDPASGIFTWRIKPNRNIVVGSIAGSMRKDGYISIRIDSVRHYAHRLAWLYMTGRWPKCIVDHEDHNTSNNQWKNLRDVSVGLNVQNQFMVRRGTATGLLGAHCDRDRFAAHIYFDGKNHHVGTYDTPLEAHEAYVDAKRQHHPGCTI